LEVLVRENDHGLVVYQRTMKLELIDFCVFVGLLTVAYVALNVGLTTTLKKHGIAPEPVKHTFTTINFWERKGELAALFTLVFMFVCFTFSEAYKITTQTGYGVIGGYKILRAAVFGVTGFVATGVFRKSSDDLARQRAIQTGDLNIARFALDKSETATAFIDREQTIVWCNNSFVRLTNQVTDTKLVGLTLDEALRPSKEVSKQLKQAFRSTSSFSIEAVVCGKIVLIRVSTMAEANSTNGFFLVLKDVTKERSLEQFHRFKTGEHQD
jgi:PAS domain-containing protein